MKKISISLVFVTQLLSLTAARSFNADDEWRTWTAKFGKIYNTPEEEYIRREAWDKSRNLVHSHNNRVDATFKMELNRRADMLPDELNTNKLWVPPTDNNIEIPGNNIYQPPPDNFDWRKREGVISPVKNQGKIDNSEVIVALECVESLMVLNTGKSVELSIQEILDCCVPKSIAPLVPVFSCIHKIGGLCTEADYPTSHTNQCHNSSCTAAFKIGGGKVVPSGREDLLQLALLQEPVMAVIDASHPSFQLYKNGVYDEPQCSSNRLDHVVQIVGYGQQSSSVYYWIVKNSWGIDWGMDGYILMSRNKNNQCGIATMVTYPVSESRKYTNPSNGVWEFMQNKIPRY